MYRSSAPWFCRHTTSEEGTRAAIEGRGSLLVFVKIGTGGVVVYRVINHYDCTKHTLPGDSCT